jgi:hypothetical protein
LINGTVLGNAGRASTVSSILQSMIGEDYNIFSCRKQWLFAWSHPM